MCVKNPSIASGMSGFPWKAITLGPFGRRGTRNRLKGQSGTHCRLNEQTHSSGHQETFPRSNIARVWNFWDPFRKYQSSEGSSLSRRNDS